MMTLFMWSNLLKEEGYLPPHGLFEFATCPLRRAHKRGMSPRLSILEPTPGATFRDHLPGSDASVTRVAGPDAVALALPEDTAGSPRCR